MQNKYGCCSMASIKRLPTLQVIFVIVLNYEKKTILSIELRAIICNAVEIFLNKSNNNNRLKF